MRWLARALVWIVAVSLVGFLVLVAGVAFLDVRLTGSGDDPNAGKPQLAPAVAQSRVKSRCSTLVEQDPPWVTSSRKTASPASFAVPRGLEERVEFWKWVWRDLDNHEFVLVDPRLPWVVHGRIDCREMYSSDTPKEQVEETCRQRIMDTLRATKERIRRRKKSRNLMLVEGRKQSLSRALDRARGKLDALEKIFQDAGLPPELARMAIVESLFRSSAVSRSGAVGAFLFVKSTARKYLMIRPGVDERKDPLRSAWAATRYLKRLHKRFGSLDLALTAYNVGPTRLARMIRKQKTRNLVRLIRSARDEGFGFDGQNYFAQIAAVLDLCADQKAQPRSPDRTITFQLTSPMNLSMAAACLDLKPAVIAAHNPAFSRAVRKQGARIPRGYLLGAPTQPTSIMEAPIVAEVQKKTILAR